MQAKEVTFIRGDYMKNTKEQAMHTYIGKKTVTARPCTAWKDIGSHVIGDPGYQVIYPDGYERSLLIEQIAAMNEYALILRRRIDYTKLKETYVVPSKGDKQWTKKL